MADMSLSHVNARGEARMVDVSAKAVTAREARAQAVLRTSAKVMALIAEGSMPKGDVLAVARVAGIMAAKKTSELIPLCHPLPITGAEVGFELAETSVKIMARVKTNGVTGVEMEALTAASVAALTVYDMVKAVDKSASITDMYLLEKSGGKSGTFRREEGHDD